MSDPFRRLTVTTQPLPLNAQWPVNRAGRMAPAAVTARIIEDSAEGVLVGQGQAIPVARFGESVDEVAETIRSVEALVVGGLDRFGLIELLPRGAARAALDAALLALEVKRSGRPVHEVLELPKRSETLISAHMLPLDGPERMAEAAAALPAAPLFRVVGNGEGDDRRIRAIRAAAPQARLILDARESWTRDYMDAMLPALKETGVELVIQPLPAGHDDLMTGWLNRVPLCADHSLREMADLERLKGLYTTVGLHPETLGGMTASLAMARAAKAAGYAVLVSSGVGTAMSVAQAWHLGTLADEVDLDGTRWLRAEAADGPGLAPDGRAPDPTGLWP